MHARVSAIPLRRILLVWVLKLTKLSFPTPRPHCDFQSRCTDRLLAMQGSMMQDRIWVSMGHRTSRQRKYCIHSIHFSPMRCISSLTRHKKCRKSAQSLFTMFALVQGPTIDLHAADAPHHSYMNTWVPAINTRVGGSRIVWEDLSVRGQVCPARIHAIILCWGPFPDSARPPRSPPARICAEPLGCSHANLPCRFGGRGMHRVDSHDRGRYMIAVLNMLQCEAYQSWCNRIAQA